jgi:uncharacterized RDD family membrane protein YckC
MLRNRRYSSYPHGRVSVWRVFLIRGPITIFGLISGLGLLDAIFILGPARRTLHDLAAGTRVVRADASIHVYDDATLHIDRS